MAEPKEHADRIFHLTDVLVHWTVKQERIGGLPGESYAFKTPAGTVWIDPLPLTAEAQRELEAFGKPLAILLTIQTHQRASWRYGKQYGAPVYAPEGAQGLDETPTHAYRAGQALPGGLQAVALPGPAFSEHGLLWNGPAAKVVFSSDLVMHRGEALELVPDAYMDAPAQARTSVETVRKLQADILCPGHGQPLRQGVSEALTQLLEKDARSHGKPG